MTVCVIASVRSSIAAKAYGFIRRGVSNLANLFEVNSSFMKLTCKPPPPCGCSQTCRQNMPNSSAYDSRLGLGLVVVSKRRKKKRNMSSAAESAHYFGVGRECALSEVNALSLGV
nr:hypothetical protein Iba_chr10eCG6540 [Ipomoea batatas]